MKDVKFKVSLSQYIANEIIKIPNWYSYRFRWTTMLDAN